jgi:hypothetical protein
MKKIVSKGGVETITYFDNNNKIIFESKVAFSRESNGDISMSILPAENMTIKELKLFLVPNIWTKKEFNDWYKNQKKNSIKPNEK